jgi:hypothetical protein
MLPIMLFSNTLPLFVFLVQLYSVAATAKIPNPIRIAFFVSKNANITEKEFHHHWSTYHGPMVTPWLKSYGILEYNQVRRSACYQDLIFLSDI